MLATNVDNIKFKKASIQWTGQDNDGEAGAHDVQEAERTEFTQP